MPAPPKTLVTGASGFVGGRVRDSWNDVVLWPRVDLTNRDLVVETVDRLLSETSFTRVLHLAGSSSVQNSFFDPVRLFEINVMGTVHLLEALSARAWNGRLLYVSSGAVYGDPEALEQPVRESSPAAPGSPYAASKLAAEAAVLEWGHRSLAQSLVARPFNHSGPGQTEHYVLPSMARQVTAALRGGRVRLEVGNLSPFRDFSHVDDVIAAYAGLLEQGHEGRIYNVASGQSRSLQSIIERLGQLAGRELDIVVDPERFRDEGVRPVDICIESLRNDTGWQPQRGLDQLLDDLITFWETKE